MSASSVAASRDVAARPSEGAGRPDTALAFVVAPGVPAGLAALAAAGAEASGGQPAEAFGAFLFLFAALSFGGYLSALLVGVPIYLLFRREGRIPPAAAILGGGATAAAPWTAFGVLSGDRGLMVVAAACFGLGCVGGLAFSLVRDGTPWRAGRRSGAGGGRDGRALWSRFHESEVPGMVAIRSTETVYRGWTSLRRATLMGGDGAAFTREIEDHGPAVAVLPYDPERGVALLVKLPRAPVLFLGGGEFLEAPAGLREAGEDPAACARREAAEEVGVALDTLEPAGHAWTMCGISTERMHLFLAPYALEHRTGAGGGLAAEHENIAVVEVPLGELRDLADRNALNDMKTLCLVQTLRLRRPELFG